MIGVIAETVGGQLAVDMAEALAGLPEPEVYPLAALPDSMRAAVVEVLTAVQCPPALAGMSALAMVSTAAQAQVDVVRDEGLDGPTSLFLLGIAESGERKSSVDRLFGAGLRDWERKALAEVQPALARYHAARESWEATRKGLTDAIRHCAKRGDDIAALQAKLAAHMAVAPEPVREPALLQTDATPEALAWALHAGWPSAGLMTAEGGLVLGGHGMQRDSIMRNLAFLNALWDGVDHRIARRLSPSYLLAGRRLTLSVQVQPAAMAQYLSDHGALARGTGWLARCLIARPPSTQGTRMYQAPVAGRPALSRYHVRIADLLAEPLPMDGERLCPRRLWLRGDAQKRWITYHDEVEEQLARGGEMSTVRDSAAKAADNAARLAALLATYDGRGEVSGEDIDRAAALVTWHLHEARRLLATATVAQPQTDAEALAAWVATRLEPVQRRDVQRCGPPRLRDGARLNDAIAVAETDGRLCVGGDGTLQVLGGGDGAG